jgi:hypothetical protein
MFCEECAAPLALSPAARFCPECVHPVAGTTRRTESQCAISGAPIMLDPTEEQPMAIQHEQIRDQQQATWDKFSAGWKKWDELVLGWLEPVGTELLESVGDINAPYRRAPLSEGRAEPDVAR